MADELQEVSAAWKWLRTGARVIVGVMFIVPIIAGIVTLVLDQRYVTKADASDTFRTKSDGERADGEIKSIGQTLEKFGVVLENVDDRTKFMCAKVKGATRDDCK